MGKKCIPMYFEKPDKGNTVSREVKEYWLNSTVWWLKPACLDQVFKVIRKYRVIHISLSKVPYRFASYIQGFCDIGKANMTTILIWLFNEMYTNVQIIFP